MVLAANKPISTVHACDRQEVNIPLVQKALTSRRVKAVTRQFSEEKMHRANNLLTDTQPH